MKNRKKENKMAYTIIDKITETNYDYILERTGKTIKIPKKIWDQLSNSKPGQKLAYGNDIMTFSPHVNNEDPKFPKDEIVITKTFNGHEFSWALNMRTWKFVKDWIRNPANRKEIEDGYKHYFSPEEAKKRFAAQFETPEYKASMQKSFIEYEKKRAEECRQAKILAQEKEKARQEMIEKIHNDIMSGACELPFYEG